jgi:hypothetical protein
MKRVGPDLKMPDLKMPPFLSDLFFDLRQRGLLPIVALVAVAIAAVPFVLGGGSDEEEGAPATGAPATLGGASAVDASQLVVVEAKPGLRDYRKRLAHRKPTDPFVQRYTAPVTKGAQFSSQTESSSSSTFSTSTETSTTATETSPVTSPGGSPSSDEGSGDGGSRSGGGGSQDEPSLTLFAFAIDVRISKSGGNDSGANGSAANGAAQASSEPTVRHKVLPLTKLPGEKAPVVTYMGPSKKGNALLLVSGKVKSVFGEVVCVSGDDACQLIEVSTEFPVTFVYGANEVHYTFHVLKMEPVVTGHT